MDEITYLASTDDLALLTGAAVDSPTLLLALRRASGRFIDSIGWNPMLVEHDDITVDGSGGDTLLLPVMHINNISSVKIDDVEIDGWAANKSAGILRRPALWPDCLECVTVSCSHGWDSGVMPEGIQDAVLEQAETQYRAISGVQSYSLGGRSVTFGAAMTVGVTQKWSDMVGKYSLGGRV